MTEPLFHYEISGRPLERAARVLVWAHGWGHNREAFRPTSASLPLEAHILLDFPGFGASPPPPETWGTEDYADAAAKLLRKIAGNKKIIWIGHSFGGRVGLQIAARHHGLLSGLCIVAGAGLPRRRSLRQKIKLKAHIFFFKAAKLAARLLPFLKKWKDAFGSADYRALAPAMKPVFVRVVNENLSEVARAVPTPALLLYGTQDTETPPDIGERLALLMPHARLTLLPGQDHTSVLGAGRHLVVKRLKEFMDSL